jgi:hypothetical protein
MKNNNQNRQHLIKLLSKFRYKHRGLNAALLWKIISFSICFGVGFQVSFISNFWVDSQFSSVSSASVVSQPKTVPDQLIVPQNNRSLLLSQVIVPFATGGRGSLEVSNVTSSQSFTKFDSPFEFTTTQLTDRIEYSIHRITLHQVDDGNATTSGVDEEEFEQY